MLDIDSSTEYETIGVVEASLGQIMGAKAQIFQSDLIHNKQKNRGQIIVRAEAVQASNQSIELQFLWNACGNVI